MLYVVTGAAGFIGSRLVAALNETGITEILAVDDLENGARAKNLFGVEIDDYLDKREFLAQLESGRLDGSIETIMHLGACSNTKEMNERYMMENNYGYSKAIFDWCQDEEVPLIYASSAAVYGVGREFAEIRENESPLNVYAYSKLLFDQYVRNRFESRTAQIAGLRYFNVYGPNEAHKTAIGMTSVAFNAFHQLKTEGRVKLFVGSDGYGDGEQVRDFVHVDDAVAVNLWLLENRDVSGILNCGTGQAQSFNDVATAVINAMNGTRAGTQEMVERKLIEYVPFPEILVGKYQSYTQADLTQLRAAGYERDFMPVEEGVAAYVRELLKA